MAEPAAESLISIVKGALRLVEGSTYVSSNSKALEKFREAAHEVVAELAKVAKREQVPDPEHAGLLLLH